MEEKPPGDPARRARAEQFIKDAMQVGGMVFPEEAGELLSESVRRGVDHGATPDLLVVYRLAISIRCLWNGIEEREEELHILRLKTMPYRDYLKTEHWQQVRTAALERAENKCQLCASTERLQVHHNNYERRGEERDSDVIALCDPCHGKFHDKLPKR